MKFFRFFRRHLPLGLVYLGLFLAGTLQARHFRWSALLFFTGAYALYLLVMFTEERRKAKA
jgi:hypothetical protein